MRQLWERIQDWVLLFVLLALSVAALLNRNEPVFRGLRAASLTATAQVETWFSWVGRYVRALDENTSLRSENIALAGEVARAREARQENARLRALLALRDTTDYPLQPARIVSKDITRQQNYLTLDVGEADSVQPGMAVIDAEGILGKIVLTSDHYALVQPYLNTEFRVPAKIQELQTAGVVRWEGVRRDRLLMEHVVKTEPVRPGQLAVTSGFSDTFPAGYPIGTVDSVAVRPGRNELLVYLRPASPLSKTQYAFVVMRRPDPERETLEARVAP